MSQALFKCNICRDKKIYTSIEADEHKRRTGHNSFKLVKGVSNE